MAQVHPHDMTMAELEALPQVDKLFKVVRSFVASDSSIWDVGPSAGVWSKTTNLTRAPGSRVPFAPKNAVRL